MAHPTKGITYRHRNGEAETPSNYGAFWVELPADNGTPFWDIWWATPAGWEKKTTVKPLSVFGPIPYPGVIA